MQHSPLKVWKRAFALAVECREGRHAVRGGGVWVTRAREGTRVRHCRSGDEGREGDASVDGGNGGGNV